MHRRLHRCTSTAAAVALGLVLLLSFGSVPVSAQETCDPATATCEEPPACECATGDAEAPAEPCLESLEEGEAIPPPPDATEPPVNEECPDDPPAEDGATEEPTPAEDGATEEPTPAEDGAMEEPSPPALPGAEEPSPPALPAPAVPVLPSPTPTPTPTPTPKPTGATSPDPSIRSASPRGSNPTTVGSGSSSDDGSGRPLARPGQASRPSLQQFDVDESGDVLDAIEPSVAPEFEALEQEDAPQIALAEPEPAPSVGEQTVAMVAPPAALPVQGGDVMGATTRMLGGVLVGFAVGFGLLLGGIQLHGRGGVEPPRRPTSPLHPRDIRS